MLPDFLRSSIARQIGKRQSLAADARSLKACIFKVDRIGDFVLALGAIRTAINHYGEDQCALVVHQLVAALARQEFPKATVIALNRNTGAGLKDAASMLFAERAEFRRYRFETLICLRHQRSLLHDIVLTWIHADRSFGIENTVLGISQRDAMVMPFRFTNVIPNPATATADFCLEFERHCAVLSAALARAIPASTMLPRFQSIQSIAGHQLVVTPFSSAPTKDYPESEMAAVLESISRRADIPLVLSGSPADKVRLESLQAIAKTRGVTASLHIAESVSGFAEFIAQAACVLTVDTASAHIATALDKPTVVIFGGAHFGHFGPWRRSNKQIWVTNRLPCFGCDWKCPYPTPECITGIKPATVSDAVINVLGR